MSLFNLILLALLVVQAVIIAVIYWPRGEAVTPGGSLLKGVTAADVTAIVIASNAGDELRLERGADGWTLAGTDGFPANGQKVDEVLGKLISINADRLVTRTEGSHSRLQVAEDQFDRRITLTTGAGDRVLYLGSSAGAGATHVRQGDAPETYLTGAIAGWELDTQPSGWVDTQYVKLTPEDISKLVLSNANGTFTFTRGEDGQWSTTDLAEGEQLGVASVDALANRVANIALTRPLGKNEQPEYGLAQPQATVVVTVRDDAGMETAHTLLLGAKDADNADYYFKSSDSPYYVTIASFTGDDLVNKQRSEFISVPTPEAVTPDASMSQDPAAQTTAEPGEFPAILSTPEAAATVAPTLDAQTPEAQATPVETPAAAATPVPANP
jgi:hypothetical protein